MNDRKPLLAMILIVAIAYLPIAWIRRQNPPKPAPASIEAPAAPVLTPSAQAPIPNAVTPGTTAAADTTPAIPEDTVVVRSGLYRYAISTRGAGVVSAQFLKYRSLNAGDSGTVELLPPGTQLLSGQLLLGNDTLHLDRIMYTANTDAIDATSAPATLTLTGTVQQYTVTLNWHFVPDDFHFDVSGEISGLGAVGGTLLLDLGNGFRDTEANVQENHRESGIITKLDKTSLTRFGQLKPRIRTTLDGPFEWVAIKSKYFVAGLFALDSSATEGGQGRIGSISAYPAEEVERPLRAQTTASLTVPAQGHFGYRLYLGPMEYDRLAAMGHDFDDVNPYGWAFLRGLIRPFAVAIRWLFIGLHTATGVSYGLAIVLFGVLVRLLLWPLNQKAMRSMTAMQGIQPELQALQEKYKADPTRLQQEMFKLYKEHKVNPLGGCWPMLIPYPLLVAVFFVLQNTIELRGQSFLWLADLSQKDHTFVIPILMAVSMLALSWVGQRGMPPNPQAKMMMYMMPAVFLVMFSSFASGLNLYYFTQNLAAFPQQWMISKERQAMMARRATGSGLKKVEVKTKPS